MAAGLGMSLRNSSKSLRHQSFGNEDNASNVSTRPVKACDEAVPDRIASCGEDDWDCRGDRLCAERRKRVAEDHSRWPVDQIGRQGRQPSVLIFRPAQFDRDVLTVDEARFVETLTQGGDVFGVGGERSAVKQSDHRHRRLLRVGSERQCNSRAADNSDELAPPHSITSSARESSVAGTSRPNAFAVLRLITSSNFVDCTTGRSVGLAPLESAQRRHLAGEGYQ